MLPIVHCASPFYLGLNQPVTPRGGSFGVHLVRMYGRRKNHEIHKKKTRALVKISGATRTSSCGIASRAWQAADPPSSAGKAAWGLARRSAYSPIHLPRRTKGRRGGVFGQRRRQQMADLENPAAKRKDHGITAGFSNRNFCWLTLWQSCAGEVLQLF